MNNGTNFAFEILVIHQPALTAAVESGFGALLIH